MWRPGSRTVIERRYLLILAAAVFLAGSASPFFVKSSAEHNPDFHANLNIFGGFLSLVAGIVLVSHFVSLRNRIHLFLGWAFFISALADLAYGLLWFYGSQNWLDPSQTGFERAMFAIYVGGRVQMCTVVILAPLVLRHLSGRLPRVDIGVWILVLALSLNGAVAATAHGFGYFTASDVGAMGRVARPVEILLGLLFALAAFVVLLDYYVSRDRLTWWVALSVVLCSVAHYTMVFSGEMYDACFNAAHVYRVIAYAIPILGFPLCQIATDMERRRAEEAFRLYVDVVDHTPTGLYIFRLEDPQDDRTLRLVAANPAAFRMTGLPTTEVVGKTVDEVFPGLREKGVPQVYARVASSGEAEDMQEMLYGDARVPAGWFSMKAFPLPDRHVGVSFENVTQSKVLEERLRSLASQLTLVEERERREIASQLHDGVGQSLALAKMRLLEFQSTLTEPDARASLEGVRDLLDEAIHHTRSLTFEISPPVLYELGFEAAVGWLVDRFEERHGIPCDAEGVEHVGPLSEETRVVMFHAVREVLFNVAKHGQARAVTVSASNRDGFVRTIVEDDGVGFDVAHVASASNDAAGFGIFNIRQRLEGLGGRCNIESAPGKGTCVTLEAPLQEGG